MDRLYIKLCDKIEDEIDDIISADSLTPAAIDILDKVVDIKKDILEIDNMDSGSLYSGRYESSYEGRGNVGGRNRNNYSRSYDKLESMYDNASSDKEREIIRKLMNQM